jgi:hypothetical protein
VSIQSEITSPPDPQQRRAELAIGGSMAFVAVRCTLQYIVLPFILPLFGISSLFSAAISVTLEVIALTVIGYNVYRLWNTSWRWGYLGFSLLVVFIIAVFLYGDLRLLLGYA